MQMMLDQVIATVNKYVGFVMCASANYITNGLTAVLVNANASKNATACLQMRENANACTFC